MGAASRYIQKQCGLNHKGDDDDAHKVGVWWRLLRLIPIAGSWFWLKVIAKFELVKGFNRVVKPLNGAVKRLNGLVKRLNEGCEGL